MATAIPDYGPAVEQVGAWIADAVGLQSGQTMFLEPVLPLAPDGVATVFEIGGSWNRERGWQEWTLLLVTRAATLAEARSLAVACINGALSKFSTAARPRPCGIMELTLKALPSMTPRDDRNRVILESQLLLRLRAPAEQGVDQ
jgi:hypothetical protein